jgi:hypothetical protein
MLASTSKHDSSKGVSVLGWSVDELSDEGDEGDEGDGVTERSWHDV